MVAATVATVISLPMDSLLERTFAALVMSGKPNIAPRPAVLIKQGTWSGPDAMCSSFKFIEQ